ncbi:hypothetical protein ABH897_003431 [Paenibacillus sp. RC73]
MANEIKPYLTDDGRWVQEVPVDGYRVESEEEIARKREYAQRADAASRNTKHYVTSYHGGVRNLTSMLSLNELGAVMKLLPYMRLDKGGDLYYEGKRMGSAEIAKAIGKVTRWTVALIGTLTKCGVLTEAKEGRRKVYAVDSEYHSIGRALKQGESFTKVYQTKTRSDVKNLTVQAAGLLYCMIPYVHYEMLYLCTNPDERDVSTLDHITQASLARIIGVDDQTARRGLRDLSKNGFVMRSEAFGAVVIRMNPDVMYRKKFDNDEYTQGVRFEFAQNKRAAEAAFDGDDEDLPF